MVFADLQEKFNAGWKQKKTQVDPKKTRKKHLCPKCGKKGFVVKMDYRGNEHVQKDITMYDVEKWKCPRCNEVDVVFHRMEGKGKLGIDMGSLYGSI